MTYWRELGVSLIGLDRAHYYLSSVHSHSYLEIHALLGAQFLGVALDLRLHSQCGEQCSLRMILVRNRRAKQLEDPIAGRLHDMAAIVIARIDHQAKCGVYDAAGFLRVEFLHHLHRALDVSEQRGDYLALAVERFRDRRFRYPHRRTAGLLCRNRRRRERGPAVLAEFR